MARVFDVTSSDGTVIRAWDSEGAGAPLVISNGLGTIPEAWPSLIAEDSGYRVVTWYHRGTFGTERPRPDQLRVEDHVEDLLAVMEATGIERSLIASWSIGVNVAFEFARLHPERVTGLLAVAGVPGGTFETMGGPLHIPARLRRPLSVRAARAGRRVGPVLTWLAPKIPVNPRTAWLIAHSGFMTPAASPDVLVPMLEKFLLHDWRWYGELALAAAAHGPMDLSFVACPVTLVAGRHDVLTSMHAVVETAARIPHAEVTVLPGSHFLPLEYPELILAALDELARRVEAFRA